MSGDKYVTGPSIILSNGSMTDLTITTPDKFGKFSVVYVVGKYNKSWEELYKATATLAGANGIDLEAVRLPWRNDDKNSLVFIKASTKGKVPVMDHEKNVANPKSIKPNQGAKINVRPAVYVKTTQVQYRRVNGTLGFNDVVVSGITLLLNGILLINEEEVKDEW